MSETKMNFDSMLIHGTGFKDEHKSPNVPIYQTSTFAFDSVEDGASCFAGEKKGFIYTRINNPTLDALENVIAKLENGYRGIVTSSGMGAVNTIYMAMLSAGDHIVSTDAIYGPSRGIMENVFSKYGVQSTYIDSTNIEEIKKAIRPNTKVLYIETPANPTMGITDLRACSKIAKDNNIKLVVDNTFCSPYLQKPLDMGADVSFHSITKFINGHADVVGGVIVAKDKELYDKLRSMMVMLGCNMDPHQAFLVLRGLKTLSIRIDRAQENAIKVAGFLEKHPKIAWIKFPGLKSHPQYDLAKELMSGPGSMISFGLKGGFEAAKKLMNNLNLIILAVSLGGVETLIQHPASMTHSKMTPDAKLKSGVTDDLIRFSVGIEDVNDIINDLDQALKLI